MATWILINTTTIAGDKRMAGRTFDDAQESLTPWQNAGAVFVSTSDATVAAAAVVAMNRHANGANELELNAIMDASVEASQAALAATVATSMTSGTATKEIPLSGILAAGTPMAAFADNAGASAPGITLADSKAVGLRWNNQATLTAIFLHFTMPDDIDVAANASIEVYASKVGATAGDLPTFTIALFNAAVGALHDADVDYGGASTAMANSVTKTVQKVTRAVALADLALPSAPVTMSVKPTDGTLGTDDLVIHGINLVYKRKLKTS